MADNKDKRDELREIDISDSGHAYENRQEIYYNDNVGGHIDAHLIPGFGTADWDGVMRALYDIGYSGTFNFECRTRHLPKAASEFAGYHLMSVARSLIDRAWKK